MSHILNWKVIDSPALVELSNGIRMPRIDKLKYYNICPISEELSKLNISSFFEHMNVDCGGSRDVTEQSRPQNMEEQFQPRCDRSAS